MKIPGLGPCVFDEGIACHASAPVSLRVLDGAECRILIEGYGDDPDQAGFHQAIAHFLAADLSVLKAAEPHIYSYFLDVKESIEPEEDFPQIDRPADLWQFIRFPQEAFVGRREHGDRGIYVWLDCECDWEPEHGLQLVFRNGLAINKVGPYDGHLTQSDAYGDSTLENVIYC